MNETASDDEPLWAAIADPMRRRLLDLLSVGQSTASELAREVPISRQAVMKHLAVLERVGLVAGRRSGRELVWTIDAARLDVAASTMARVATEWDRRLSRIKLLAEAKRDVANRKQP